PKMIELVRELLPRAATVALLINPGNPAGEYIARDLVRAASPVGIRVYVFRALDDSELDSALAEILRLRTDALVIGADASLGSRSEMLAALSIRHGIPALYPFRHFAEVGGLMSYGGSDGDAHRIVGIYTGRILKGENPVDLPVQQVTKVELVINLRTARVLG